MRKITDKISYLPASTRPLSSDVGLIHGDKYEWIFDIGRNQDAEKLINAIDRPKILILSHFHKDHTDNLNRISCERIYCGNYTRKKFERGTAVTEPITFEDGVKVTLFPIPSPHAKGCIGAEINEEYAFLGDSIYGVAKRGELVYNVNLLRELISKLENIKAEKFLISHDAAFVIDKETVIMELKEILCKSIGNEKKL